MSRKNGFTLIELILAMTIFTLFLGMAWQMVRFSNVAFTSMHTGYTQQNDMRTLVYTTRNTLEKASAIFTVPQGRYTEENLTDGWHYIGVSNDQSEVVQYIYEDRAGVVDHYKKVIMPATPGVHYEMVFVQTDPLNKDDTLSFKIKAINTATGDILQTLETEVQAMNALQVVDRGTASNPATAIAYKLEERPQNQIVGSITLVVDVSGSMKNALDSTTATSTNISRLDNVKRSLLGYTKPDGSVEAGMINTFALEENIEISLVPFSTSANYPSATSISSSGTHPYYTVSVQTERDALRTVVANLSHGGGTNTGDGMRRAYENNMAFKNGITSHADYGTGYSTKDYMIILVDGVTTFASSVGGSGDARYKMSTGYHNNLTWYSNPSWWNNAGIIGRGNTEDPVTDRYVELIGSKIKYDKLKVYVIGFSSVASELNSVNKIATAAGALSKDVYKFTDNLDLDDVFNEIRKDIMKDLWHVRGPKM